MPDTPPAVPNSPYPPRPPVVDPDRQTITRPIGSPANGARFEVTGPAGVIDFLALALGGMTVAR